MNTMHYLFAAYAAIWIILAIYMFSIHSREKRLREDVDRLKQLLAKQMENASEVRGQGARPPNSAR